MGMTGMDTKMYNVIDIDRAGDWIGVCEGELDTLHSVDALVSLVLEFQVQTLGRNITQELLADFDRVFVFADGDQPGKEFANRIS
jgi:5S rRNA maturation endonuclease (ribonuclease M5)